MTAPVFSVDDFLAGLQGLMPRGPIWQSDPNSVQGKLERGLVTTWARLNQADVDLLVDAFPATAVGLLPEWEDALGLPDPCAGEAPTIAQRQQQVVARLTDKSGLSSARFVELAASLGYTITVTMFSMSRAGEIRAGDFISGPEANFTWRVNAPYQSINYLRAGSARAGDSLGTFGNTVLECELEARAPAYTVVTFAYGSDLHDGFSVDFGTGLNWLRPIGGLATVYSSFTSFFTFTRASSGTYRGSDGLLHTAANDVARIEYDATGNVIGLLLEKASTNKFLRSQQFDNAAWAKNASSVTADQVAAPDGTVTADQWIEDNTNAEHRLRQTIATTAGATVGSAVFAKAGTRTILQIRLLDNGSVGDIGVARFDLVAGTVLNATALGAATGVSATIEPYQNGYRCALVAKPNGTMTSCVADFFLCDAAGNASYAGDGISSMFIWGAQFEEGSLLTSYTATTNVAVTRAQDRLSRNVGSEFNGLAGSMFVDGINYQSVDGTNQFNLYFSDASFNNLITLSDSATGFPSIVTAHGGVFDGNATSSVALSDGVRSKLACAYASNDLALSLNGAAVVTDASAVLPTGLTRLDVGSDHNGTNNVQRMHIRAMSYQPQRLSNAQLQALAA